MKTPTRWLFAFVAFSSMLFGTSCTQKEASSAVQYAGLSGQDLFTSIYFAHGEFAQDLSFYEEDVRGIAKLPLEEKEKFEEQLNKLLKIIDAESPGFFDQFKTAVLSKNHHRIKGAIIDGNEHIQDNLDELYPNIDKVYQKFEEDIDAGKILTDGEFDQAKFEDQLEDYNGLLTENMTTNGVEGFLIVSGCIITCAASASTDNSNIVLTTVFNRMRFVPTDKREIIGNDENLLALEMLVDEIATKN